MVLIQLLKACGSAHEEKAYTEDTNPVTLNSQSLHRA